MLWFLNKSRDRREPRDYLQILKSKKIWLQSRIWACIHDCNYFIFSCWSVHVSFVPWDNVLCVTWVGGCVCVWGENLKWAFYWSETHITIQQGSPSAVWYIPEQPQKHLSSLFELLDHYVLPYNLFQPLKKHLKNTLLPCCIGLAECSHPGLLLCFVMKDRQERNLAAWWIFVLFSAVFCPSS